MEERQSVLLVDDEAVVRNSLSEWLKDDGFEVETAEDGESALELLEKRRFDTGVVDLKMPGIDGLEILKRTKQVNPNTNIIIITAYGTIENAVKAMKLGASDYLAKPFTPNELEKAIEEARIKAQAGAQPITIPATGGEIAPAVPEVEREIEVPVEPEVAPKECIWSKAGIVDYRVCTNGFMCDTCDFGRKMMEKGSEATGRPMMAEAIKTLLEKPGPKRACRYMLSGDVSYRLCSNLYQCNKCSFNEMMQERLEAEAERLVRRAERLQARRLKKAKKEQLH
jgi:CheY-like chemotaxis protein